MRARFLASPASLAFALAGLLLGCTPNPSGGAGGAGSAAAPVASASSSGEVPEGGPPKTGASALETWSGKYASEPGSLYVVDGGAWAEVKWRGDEAGVGLGDGNLTLLVNRQTHEVRGNADGAIGGVVLVGSIADETITASVLRREPLDRGFTGTAVAKVSAGAITGSMRLSVANARVIREVKFTLAPSSSPSPGKP